MQYYLTQPTFSKSDCIVRALNFLSCTVKDAPATIYHKQLTPITKLSKLFNNWYPLSMTMMPKLITPLILARSRPEHPPPIPPPPPVKEAMLPPRVVPPQVASPPRAGAPTSKGGHASGDTTT